MAKALSVKIKDKKVTLFLKEEGKIFDRRFFAEDYNLSEKLLPEIDKILRKNNINPEDVEKLEVRTDTPESFTTSRIAKAAGKAWNFAVSFKS
jgi:tRNA A37 threonylcarbamoyladenosine modification protein TsaB